MSLVRYGLGVHIPVDGILHSHRREDLKCCIVLAGLALFYRPGCRGDSSSAVVGLTCVPSLFLVADVACGHPCGQRVMK
jgi:hypothetical protein